LPFRRRARPPFQTANLLRADKAHRLTPKPFYPQFTYSRFQPGHPELANQDYRPWRPDQTTTLGLPGTLTGSSRPTPFGLGPPLGLKKPVNFELAKGIGRRLAPKEKRGRAGFFPGTFFKAQEYSGRPQRFSLKGSIPSPKEG